MSSTRLAPALGPLVALALLALACGQPEAESQGPPIVPAPVADADWPLHGRTHDEQRHSPLAAIERGNVADLGLAWSYPTGTTRGLEATPIVIDGVLYGTASWSIVFALDAATGRELWRHDPGVARAKGRDACCDVVNRGVAHADGRIFVGVLDGRLQALDAATGALLWETLTVDPSQPYTITAAPRVAKGKVFIGNGGAEFGVRGYVSAYDAETGQQLWRFYTVPASKQGPHEHPELALAAETWPANALWESGLGGTVWDSITFDPELDLLYVGTGNASVYHRDFRSPGGGDNLFLASILALRPDSGELVWHYQTTPGEHFDYTATQQMVLAELEIEGRLRKVLLQAPKNGFFYALDRETGELLSAEKYVHVSWASHVDPETGRPSERPEASWEVDGAVLSPAIFGGHSWHPMSFHPGTGWMYIPTMQNPYLWEPDPDFEYTPGRFNTGEDFGKNLAEYEGFEALAGMTCGRTRLLAWDPVAQRKVWEIPFDTSTPGGVLTTAGDLVFQGNGTGFFSAYAAEDGERVWSDEVGIPIMAPPISYAVDGEQYVAVLAGLGGAMGLQLEKIDHENEGRVLAWKLGGDASMPPVRHKPARSVAVPPLDVPSRVVDLGRDLYANHCLRCHGLGAVSPGLLPDLRLASREVHEQWNDIVLGGTRAANGMASFADVLDVAAAEAIHAYVLERAHQSPTLLQRVAGFAAQHVCIPISLVTD